MVSEVTYAAVAALTALGQMWRNDWSDFDGRTLKSQISDITFYMTNVNMSDEEKVEGLKLIASEYWRQALDE